MNRWHRLFEDRPRVVAGVMSGTSMDGIDVAVARLEGSGRAMSFEMLSRVSVPFPDSLSAEIRLCAEAVDYPVDAMCRLGPRLAKAYAAAVRESGVSEIDLVGCHGQTVRHQPEPAEFADAEVRATLQLVSGPALAAELALPVVTDFRSADVALGGQGAPLVPYADWALLSSDDEDRIALNLGGIANVTALPRGGGRDKVTAFDTGPANMLLDTLARELLGAPMDANGAAAAQGQVLTQALEEVLMHPYFDREPPKSAGREAGEAGFGQAFADRFRSVCGESQSPEDLLATATELTAVSVARAVERFLKLPDARVIAAGGGTRNAFLMDRLAAHLPRVSLSDEFGVDAHFKEALAFAVLAHEAVRGVPTGMPSVTGATRAAVLGSISWP